MKLIPIAAAGVLLAAGAAQAAGHTVEADLRCEEREVVATITGNNWPEEPSDAFLGLVANENYVTGETRTFNDATPASIRMPAPPGEFRASLTWLVVGSDGFTDNGQLNRRLTCWTPSSPPKPSPEPPPPTPPPSPAPSPETTTPPPSAPSPPVIPVGPDKPTRTVTKRTTKRVVRGCIGPWAKHPRIRGVRAKRGPDGRWYSYRDVRVWTTTYITIRDGDEVRRGRRTKHKIVSRGTYCGPVSPPVTG